jgi:signal transduction histidine kinase
MAGSSTDMPDARERETARVMLGDARLRNGSWALMPLATNQRAMGLLALWHGEANAYPPDRMQILAVFARQAAVVTESVQLRREEKRAAVMAERSRLANELHDSVSQAVFGSLLGIKVARETLDNDRDKTREALDYAERLSDAAIVEMRALIFELRPETLQNEGLVNALDKQVAALCQRHGLQAVFDAPHGEPTLTDEDKESLYRIALEAVHNAVRHAHASMMNITLDDQPAQTILVIADNGQGFDAGLVRSGAVGINGMRVHAEEIGANFALDTAPGKGTRITVALPKSRT